MVRGAPGRAQNRQGFGKKALITGKKLKRSLHALALIPILGLLAGLAAVGGPQAARAIESDWVEGHHNKVRLIAAPELNSKGDAQTGNWIVGVQIRLDPSWKTYWRMPGDAGVPPSFDWTGSKNLATPKVLYPAPRRFKDPYGTAIGYAEEVIFPARIVPVAAGQPVRVKLAIQYGVCKDICVFANADLSLSLGTPDRSSPHWPLIERALEQVPVPMADAGADYPRLVSAKTELSSGQRRFVFEADFPSGTTDADLFLLTPDDVYIPLAEPVGEGDGKRRRFSVDLSQLDDVRALRRASIGVVLTDGRRAVETQWTVPWALGDAGGLPATILDRDD